MNDLPVSPLSPAGDPAAGALAPPAARLDRFHGPRRPAPPKEGSPSVGKTPLRRNELEETVKELNRFFSQAKGIRFELTEGDKDLVVQVVDLDSDEVIRSVPPERLLSFKEEFRDLTGILLDDRA